MDGACGPCFGECGEEADFAEVALEQHFGDAGTGAEVGFDLEGSGAVFPDSVEEVCGGVAGDHSDETIVSGFGVAEAGVEVGLPGAAPADGSVAAPLE